MAERSSTDNVARLTVGRQWAMRSLAVLLPIFLIALLELSFRMAGAYEDDGWSNPYVSFDKSAIPFPAWSKEIKVPKPLETIRIVALGGSSTFGFGVDKPFAQLIQQQLSAKLPDRHAEVINGGAHAIGSHRVFEVLKRSSDFDVEIALVYLGHNEFLEEIFFDPESFASRAEQLGRFARQFRVVNWLRSFTGDIATENKPRLQRHFFGNTNFPLIKSKQQYELRLQFLQSNIEEMIDFADAHDIQIIFMPAVPNLLSPPGDSKHGPGYDANPTEWERLFARSENLLQEAFARSRNGTPKTVQWSEIVEIIHKLHVIDDQYAMSHYILGLAELAQGNSDEGSRALQDANLYDQRGDRANNEVIEVILNVCDSRHISTIDMRDQFYSQLPAEFQKMLSGDDLDLFLDHCHPTQKGHQIIADGFVREIVSPPMWNPG